MPLHHRLVQAGAPAVLLAVLLAACGTTTGGTDGATAGGDPAADQPREYGGEVVGVRTAGHDRLELTIVTDYDSGRCASSPRARLEREPGQRVLHVTTTYDALPEGAAACLPMPTAPFTVHVRGLDGYDALVTDTRGLWEPTRGAAWASCSPEVGCDPPADRCDPAWTGQLGNDVELPPEKRIDVLACESPWMVADVDAVVTGCQSLDGSTPPAGCDGSGVHRRWFAHWDGETWDVVASGTAAGCTDVAGVPGFPRRLCAELPAR